MPLKTVKLEHDDNESVGPMDNVKNNLHAKFLVYSFIYLDTNNKMSSNYYE